MVVELPEESAEESTEKSAEQVEVETVLEEDRSENPRGAYKEVSRLDEITSEPAFIGRFPVDVVSAQFLAKRFGGGSYRVVTRKPNPKGPGHVYVERRTIKVDAAAVPPKAIDGSPLGTTSDSGFLEKMLFAQMQANTQLMQAIMTGMSAIAARPAPVTPATDPILGAIITRIISQTEDKPDQIEQLTKLVSLGKMIAGGGKETDWMDLSKEGLSLVRELASNRGKQLTPQRQIPAQTDEEPPHTEQPKPEEVDVSKLRVWQQAVAPLLPKLGDWYKVLSPRAAAATVWDGASPEAQTDLRVDLGTVEGLSDEDQEKKVTAFVERSFNALEIVKLPGDVPQWVVETLWELAGLALEPDEEGEPDDGAEISEKK
jgi:hypothetical protein